MPTQTVTVQQAIEFVSQCLNAGQIDQGEPVLAQILQQHPNLAEANHLAAYVANARRNYPAAEQFLRRAIALDPNVAVYHQNLGALLRATNRPDEAAQSYRSALKIQADLPESLLGLGLLLEEKDQLTQAMDLYRRAVAIRPNYAEAHCTIGDVYCKQEQYEQAMACYDQALRINPNLAEALANRGNVLSKQGRNDEAMATTLRALQINPHMFHALRAMGIYCAMGGQFDQSAAFFLRALQVDPNSTHANHGLAITYLRAGKPVEAVEYFHKSIQCDPKFVDPYVNLGLALTDLGKHDQALAVYEQALALDPKCDSTRSNRAIIHLLRRDLERGFADYEHRWNLPEFQQLIRDFGAPRWDGSDPKGKRILIWREQGLGDTIQCIRYAKLLARQGATVVAQVQPSLVTLLKDVEGVHEIVSADDPQPRVDVHTPMLSLPYLFKTRVDNIPAEIPYIHADPDRVQSWRQKMAPHGGFRVGLTWRGNPMLRLEHARSITLSHLAPLGNIPNVSLFSLQMGPGSEQTASPPRGMKLIDLTSGIGDFSDTAAIVENLDLVIAVDTAIVHLAGAMGKPVWLLLAKWPDWRWQLDREDSPWYPTMRIFRQPERSQWGPVIQRVAAELQRISSTAGNRG